MIWGTLLGAIPLIIHLLNRRRFRRVEWAPMHYLKLTIQRNRRRIQLEQLLLLLLRIALPVLLFFYLARPVLNPTGLEQWLGTGGRSSQVVLIDDSLSMGYAAGEPPAFQRAQQAAAALLASVRPQDRCTVVTTSAPRAPVLHDVEGGAPRRACRRGGVRCRCPPRTPPGRRCWTGVDEVLRSCTYPTRQLTIVTDLRKSGWERGVDDDRPALERAGRARADRRRRRRRGRQRRAPGARAARSHDPGRVRRARWEAVIQNDSPRTLAGRQGDPPRRRQADRGARCRRSRRIRRLACR